MVDALEEGREGGEEGGLKGGEIVEFWADLTVGGGRGGGSRIDYVWQFFVGQLAFGVTVVVFRQKVPLVLLTLPILPGLLLLRHLVCERRRRKVLHTGTDSSADIGYGTLLEDVAGEEKGECEE